MARSLFRAPARAALTFSLLSAPFLLLGELTPAAFAQQTSGDLVGSVKDSTGAVVPNAAVTVTNEATGVRLNTATTSAGDYRANNLLPGNYDVVVNASGFQPFTLTGVLVTLNATATANVTVAVGTSQVVEVSAESGAVLDTTSQNLSQTFQPQELATLPVTSIGQGVINASLLVPGVSSTGGTGLGVGPSVAGQRQRDNNFMIEGIDNNNKSVTGPLVQVPNDAVSNFTVITTQFSPEFGHSAGGQFNTNVISGTNTFHGKLYEYFQNRNLNAALGTAGNKVPLGRYDNNRYGGQLGGPILKDKLFFFANFERQTNGQNVTNSQCVPDTAGRATLTAAQNTAGFSANNIQQYLKYLPLANAPASQSAAGVCGISNYALTSVNTDAPTYSALQGNQGLVTLGVLNVNAPTYSNQDRLVTSMDYTLSAKDSIRGRYIYNTLPAFDIAASLPSFYLSNPTKYHLVALSEFHTFTPNLINEFRIGFNRYANTTVVGPQTYPGLDSFPNLEFADTSGNIVSQIGPDPNAPSFTIQNLYQATDNINYTKGKHTITFGFDGRKYISPQGFTQRARGDYEYNNTSDFLHDFAPDANSIGERSSGSHTYYGDQTALYGYANDTFRALSSLTVNFGVRYEFTSVPVGERSQNLNAIASAPGVLTFGTPQPSYKSVAPRIGIEYAPDSKTSIRLGYGIAYDVLFDNLGTLSFPPEFSVTQDVGVGTAPAPGSANFLKNGGLPPGSGSGTTTFATAAAARAATSAYVPNQIVPYSENYTLTIQHQLGSGLTAEVGYIGDRGIHLPTQVQLNIQPAVNATNYLPTLVNGTSINGQGTNASTLANIRAQASAAGQGATTAPYYRPAFYSAGFTSTITSYQPYSQSNYNGLVANLQGHMRNGLQLQLSYTYSKTMDDATAEVFATSLTPRRPQNPANINADYSRSALDHTHRITLESDYDFQAFKGSNWLLRNVVANWTFAPIYTYESPEYATVLNGTNALILPSSDGTYLGRPIFNPSGVKNTVSAVTAITRGTDIVGYTAINPSAQYIQAGSGTLPTAGRNTLAGRPINNVDFSAFKRFTAFERYSIEVGAQAFNVLNHAQYIPGSVDDAGTYSYTGLSYQTILNGGKPSATFNHPELAFGNNPRTMQLTGKFIF